MSDLNEFDNTEYEFEVSQEVRFKKLIPQGNGIYSIGGYLFWKDVFGISLDYIKENKNTIFKVALPKDFNNLIYVDSMLHIPARIIEPVRSNLEVELL